MKPRSYIIIYFILALLYFTKSFFLGEETSIGRPILIYIILTNIYYLAKCFRLPNKPQILNALLVFILLNIAYYLWGDMMLHNVPPKKSFQIFKTILISTTCIFPVYYWGRRGFNLKSILLLFALLYFVVIYISGLSKNDTEDFVDNMGYYYLNFIPFLFLIDRKTYLKIGLCLVLNVLIISCAKRGAIITAAIVDILFFVYVFKYERSSRDVTNKFWLLILLACTAVFVVQKFQSNAYVLERFTALEDGNSSGRDIIYQNLWENWCYRYDIVQRVFGGGFCKSPHFNNGLFAHNDWLELLTDLGLVGVVAYLFVIWGMIKLVRRTNNKTYKYLIATITVIWFTKTLFSMSYLEENSFVLMLLLGFIAAKLQINERRKTTLVQRT